MSTGNFYAPEEVRALFTEIIPAYQVAFSGEPWNEVSKCADQMQRCIGGLSSLAIGTTCQVCDNSPSRPAYEPQELAERFEALAATRQTAWYTEQLDKGLTLAAVAWKARPKTIAEEKYSDVPEMSGWLQNTLGDQEIMWLDEVFANKALKPCGNLQNFGKFVTGLANKLDTQTVAYRTIEPRMLWAARRDFGQAATILECIKGEVPDRRDFVVINIEDKAS